MAESVNDVSRSFCTDGEFGLELQYGQFFLVGFGLADWQMSIGPVPPVVPPACSRRACRDTKHVLCREGLGFPGGIRSRRPQ